MNTKHRAALALAVTLAIGTGNYSFAESPAPDTSTAEITAEGKITAHYENAPLTNVISFFRKVSGATIVYDPKDLPGNATVNLEDVEWKPALRVILDTLDCEMLEPEPGIILIARKRAKSETEKSEMSAEQFGQILTGEFIGKQMNALGRVLEDPAFAASMATFDRNYYDALVKKGFTEDQAFKLLLKFDAANLNSSK